MSTKTTNVNPQHSLKAGSLQGKSPGLTAELVCSPITGILWYAAGLHAWFQYFLVAAEDTGGLLLEI